MDNMEKVEYYLKKGKECYHAGKFNQAEKCYRQILSVCPKTSAFLNLLSGTLLKQNKNKEALETAHQAKKTANTANGRCLAYRTIGEVHEESGRKALAERFYRKALDVKPNLAANMYLGMLLFDTDRREEAKKYFKQALKLNPDFEEAHYYMGLYYMEKGKRKLAERSFRRAVSLDPKYIEAISNLGYLAAKAGRFKEARNLFAKAVRLNDKNIANVLYLALTLRDLRRLKEAESTFKKAISIDPKVGMPYACYGHFLFLENKDPKLAEKMLRKAIQLDPKLRAGHLYLGEFLYHRKGCKAARPFFQKAVRLGFPKERLQAFRHI